jgi:hypothetical protein
MRHVGFREDDRIAHLDAAFRAWSAHVVDALGGIFPSEREAFLFVRSDTPGASYDDGSVYGRFYGSLRRTEEFVRRLDEIRLVDLARYTDLPMEARIYVEDIDSFAKVRDVNPSVVAGALRAGRIELSEDYVQMALEQILDVPFHRRDWGGETNDLYTTNVIVNGRRTATAFARKGRGCKSRELTISDCGKNGDQLVRLVESPAQLFVVQYVGPVADAVVKDLAGKIEERRGRGKACCFCVMDGQDTARLLRAYGKLDVL